MYLFYVVDGLDIKIIEKKMNIFVCYDFFPDYYRFFPRAEIIPIMISAILVLIVVIYFSTVENSCN